MALPRVFVEDATRAEAAHYGILSPAVTVVEDTDGHWTGGMSYESRDCGTSSTISSVCSNVDAVQIVEGEEDAAAWRDYSPFIVETEFAYTTRNISESDYESVAIERLLACQQKTIETEFWRGVYGRSAIADDPMYPNRFLTRDPVDLTPTGGPVKPKYGQALLEDALGACGCGVRGTLHMTRGTASSLGLGGSDGVLMTGLDNYVIAGAGYDGSGPSGNAPTDARRWMYATGPVTVRLGEISTRSSVDTRNNKVHLYADRPVAVTWDTCCHYAVQVDLAADYS